jgi:hypothetical protein
MVTMASKTLATAVNNTRLICIENKSTTLKNLFRQAFYPRPLTYGSK